MYAWYPMSSGYESGGYGLVNLDGSITDRAKTAGAVARAVERNAVGIDRAHEKLSSPAIQAAANDDETVLQKNLAPNVIWIVRLGRK
ncbi:MAG: hypothetical protein ACYCSP_04055 [Acidobacteriaceae bacterium]